MLGWFVVVSIIAFGIGVYVGEYRVMSEALQLLYESKQALTKAAEYHENAKILIRIFNEASDQEAAREN